MKKERPVDSVYDYAMVKFAKMGLQELVAEQQRLEMQLHIVISLVRMRRESAAANEMNAILGMGAGAPMEF